MRKRPNYLYAISTKTYVKQKLIKVGMTYSPKRRFAFFETYMPEPVEVLFLKKLPQKYRDSHIHRMFKLRKIKRLKRVNGKCKEWFVCTLKDVKWAYENMKSYDVASLIKRLNKEQSRRRRDDPELRDKINTRNRQRYHERAKDPAFREEINRKERVRYHKKKDIINKRKREKRKNRRKKNKDQF